MSARRSGDRAPAFTLPGTGGRDYSLADYAGQPVVLVFYPGDDTPVCTKQLNSYNDGLDQFTDLGAQVLAISAQDVASHERFSAKHGGFEFPLLADTDKAVAGAYGTLGPIGFPRRSVFIVDGDGVVRYAHRAIAGLTYRPVSELVGASLERAAERLGLRRRSHATDPAGCATCVADGGRATSGASAAAILRTCVRRVHLAGARHRPRPDPLRLRRRSTAGARRRPRPSSLGVIRTPAADPLPQRLAALRAELAALIAEFRPDAVAVEHVFFQVNVRTAMSVGQASGLALAEAAAAGCEVAQYTPEPGQGRRRRLGRRGQGAGAEDGPGPPRG